MSNSKCGFLKLTKYSTGNQHFFIFEPSVADPDPDFYPSWIPYPRAAKEKREKLRCPTGTRTFSVATKAQNLKLFF
jgi:hypothetical protein